MEQKEIDYIDDNAGRDVGDLGDTILHLHHGSCLLVCFRCILVRCFSVLLRELPGDVDVVRYLPPLAVHHERLWYPLGLRPELRQRYQMRLARDPFDVEVAYVHDRHNTGCDQDGYRSIWCWVRRYKRKCDGVSLPNETEPSEREGDDTDECDPRDQDQVHGREKYHSEGRPDDSWNPVIIRDEPLPGVLVSCEQE